MRTTRLAPQPLRWAALLLAICLPAQAGEGEAPSQTADALFEQGKKLLDAGATDEACNRFAESQRIEPAVGTLGMLAWCRESQGRIASAWREYLAAAELAAKQGDRSREKAARQRVAALQVRLSTIRVEVREPLDEIVVTLSGSPVSRSDWGKAIPVDPGQYPVVASADGYQPWTSTAEVTGDSLSVVVEVPALQRIPAKPIAIVPVAPPPPRPPQVQGRAWLAPAIAGGVGVAGLALGTYFGVRTLSKTSQSQEHCDDSNACDPAGGRLRDEARSSAIASNISFGVGIAATAVGVVLWLRTPARDHEARPRPAIVIAPELSRNVAGVGLSGAF